MNYPNDILYAKTHEWVKDQKDGTALIGISDFAQNALGDIVYIEFLCDDEDVVPKGEPICEVESVKASESVYAPISVRVLKVNSELEENEYKEVNKSCYKNGWLIKADILDKIQLNDLLDAQKYKEFCEKQEN
ncbi:MAG: glycine cleavage system protein GcvH [Candidatus Lokiarchaeota archaeon]|nr:glycine cleavage system protein GcvH [Candidatus Lokiarchaeota archaeon]